MASGQAAREQVIGEMVGPDQGTFPSFRLGWQFRKKRADSLGLRPEASSPTSVPHMKT